MSAPLRIVRSRHAEMVVPEGATDTHVHVFEPARFPFSHEAPNWPQPGECGGRHELTQVLDVHGMERVVLVNPTSGYGDDLACMLWALEALGPRARGIARVPVDTDAAALRALRARGVAGVRLDFVGAPQLLGDVRVEHLLARLADLDLLADVQCERDQMAPLFPVLTRIPVRIVVDHLGRPDPARGTDQPGFEALLRLAADGRTVVKLSGLVRFSSMPPPHRDADPFVRAAVSAFGSERMVFGSDWPFLRSPRRMDYGPELARVAHWFPRIEDRRRVLVDTPAAWFGFEPCGQEAHRSESR